MIKFIISRIPNRARTAAALFGLYIGGLLAIYGILGLTYFLVSGGDSIGIATHPPAFMFTAFIAFQFVRNGLAARPTDRIEALILMSIGIIAFSALAYLVLFSNI